ncbi:MAG TPA: translational GTPase TypA [Geminicoccaceae bacterium]|nr:translational GTPase TypA [Geminicoccaceae bacterium]
MDLRNVAIIAHVDHGKTTLVDRLLQQSGTFRANQQVAERALDSNDLEREKGITILAKCTSVVWRGNRINIVDTPGHADFGGEVERILSMVDGVLLLVDAAEGPMPQTKFVLGKALRLGLRPIVIINKVDKAEQRAHEVHDEVFDLFAALDASEAQLDFPTLFASAKQGWAATDPEGPRDDMAPLFELIRRHVPPPTVDPDGPFRMLATTLERDPHLGRLLTGRIESGRIQHNATIKALGRDGALVEQTRITKLLAFRGLERVALEEAAAGDIVAVAGFDRATVADTLADLEVTAALPAQPIDPPTLAMAFSINDSPLAGQEGTKLTSRMVGERLRREAEGNVAIRVTRSEGRADAFEVAGRGELQLAVLIETMRREGYELSVGRPRVLFRADPATGQTLEPIEEVVVDVDEEFAGAVVDKLGRRRADLVEMRPAGAGKQRLVFHAPSRALIGYHGEFLTDTRGTGVMNRVFHGYAPHRGPIEGRRAGVLVSLERGEAVAYALWNLEDRGILFVGPGEKVYPGMVIGEHARPNDLDVNPLKGRQLTNIRAAAKDENVILTPPTRLTLEQAIAYIADDELVEVTPESVRLRKRHLDANERRKEAKRAAVA